MINILYICTALSRKTEGNGPMMSWQPALLTKMQWCQLQPKQLGRDEAIQISLSPTLLIFC